MVRVVIAAVLLFVFGWQTRAGENGQLPEPLQGCWRSEDGVESLRFLCHKCLRFEDGQLRVYNAGWRDGRVVLRSWIYDSGRPITLGATKTDNELLITRDGKTTAYRKLESIPPQLDISPLPLGTQGEVPPERLQEIQQELTRRVPRRGIKADADNTAYVKKLVAEYGWIDVERFGQEASKAAFLIVQHSGDLRLMQAVLPEIEKDLKAGRLREGQPFALLYDRVRLLLGEKQRYGTQIGTNARGERVVLPLEDRKRVAEFRRQIGLFPLKQYLEFFSTFAAGGKPIKFADEELGGTSPQEGEAPTEPRRGAPKKSARTQPSPARKDGRKPKEQAVPIEIEKLQDLVRQLRKQARAESKPIQVTPIPAHRPGLHAGYFKLSEPFAVTDEEADLSLKPISGTQTERPFWLLVPASYNKEKPLPLVIVLHQRRPLRFFRTGMRFTTEDLPKFAQSELDAWRPLAEKEGFLLAVPLGDVDICQMGIWWRTGPREALFESLISTIQKSHAVDSSRIYVVASGEGAHVAIATAVRCGNLITAVAACNPPLFAGKSRRPYQNERLPGASEIILPETIDEMLAQAGKNKAPLLVLADTAEKELRLHAHFSSRRPGRAQYAVRYQDTSAIPVEHLKLQAERLRQAGFPVEFRTIPGPHFAPLGQAMVPCVWQWLRQHKRR